MDYSEEELICEGGGDLKILGRLCERVRFDLKAG